MGAYEYKALDQRGKQKKGVLEADSPRMVRQQLRERGLTPLAVDATASQPGSSASPRRSRSRISVTELSLLTRQLATLIQAGIPIEESLRAAAAQTEKGKIRSMLLSVRGKVMEGHTLADSLADYPNAFPKLYRSTVSAGEHSGHLDAVLERLADYMETRHESQQQIKMAAVYPILLTLMSIVIVIFLLTYVVPQIVDVFNNSGQKLPVLTQVLISSSEFLKSNGIYLLILLALFVAAIRYALSRPGIRYQFHKRLLFLPFIRRFSRGMNTARFASTVSILSSSGVPLVEAMRIAGEVLDNDCLSRSLEEATRRVSEGSSLHGALQQTGYFPPLMLHMIASGETSGELDQMLSRTATNQEKELERLLTTLVRLFEPAMLLFMGGVVLVIVLAIVLPILNMSALVS